MQKRVKADAETAESIKAFLEIGNERNRLVHQNFGTFALEKNANEIYNLYVTARPFVEGLSGEMQAFLKEEPQDKTAVDV